MPLFYRLQKLQILTIPLFCSVKEVYLLLPERFVSVLAINHPLVMTYTKLFLHSQKSGWVSFIIPIRKKGCRGYSILLWLGVWRGQTSSCTPSGSSLHCEVLTTSMSED